MRNTPSILHVDMDAFFSAVEQRDKPTLRGRPVVVGGTGGRGVVATCSYEARKFGIRSAMSVAEARSRCPNAAFLTPRFDAYRTASQTVMDLMRELSPLVEPVSIDEAYIDLAAAGQPVTEGTARQAAADLKTAIRAATGLTASVGAGSSKMIAKIASDARKPDGLYVIGPGDEIGMLHPLPVTVLSGVGPATAARLRQSGITTVADLHRQDERDLTSLLGQSAGTWLHRLARADDDRPVVPDRDAKSHSAEDTFERDVTDRAELERKIALLAAKAVGRLRAAGHAGRTVTLKVKMHDFQSLTRSLTLQGATDDPDQVTAAARGLLAGVDTSNGVRLVGVAVSGLTAYSQPVLFADQPPPTAAHDTETGTAPNDPVIEPAEPDRPGWLPGQDAVHAEHGPGWVQGAGHGRVTVRFETPNDTRPGPVRTFADTDPALSRSGPVPWHPDPDAGR